MARFAMANSNHNPSNETDEICTPGTVHLVDLGNTLTAQHARNRADILLVPVPLQDPEDPLNWSPKRKYLALACALL
jgi:hypothetical protein